MIKGYIYEIKCIVNNKKYIGSSIQPSIRRASHFCKLRKKTHHSKKLQNSFNLYGEINFIFKIIESEIDQSEIFIREQYWIDHYDSYQNGLNSRKNAAPPLIGELNGMFGKKLINNGDKSHLRKSVISYCITTGEVCEYESINYAGSIVGGTQFIEQIKNPLKRKKFKNKFWFYSKDFCLNNLKIRFEIISAPHHATGRKKSKEEIEKISSASSGRKHSEKSKKLMRENKLKMGKQILRSDGKIFDNVSSVAKEMGCSKTTIYRYLNKFNFNIHLNGFTFEYLS